MRLREITASNEVLLKLSQTKTDFTETYNEISSILLAARASVGMSHNRGFVNILIQAGIPAKLDYFENNITGLFENIKLYSTTNLQSEPSNYGINLSALTPGITSMNNTFNNIFINNFERLSDSVKSRLVLENNDNVKGVWSVENLIKYFPEFPITFDTLHHKMLPGNLSEEQAFNAAYDTWKFEPIFHYSEGKDNTRAHKDMADNLPPNYGRNVIWDVELKGKDYAILEMINRRN